MTDEERKGVELLLREPEIVRWLEEDEDPADDEEPA